MPKLKKIATILNRIILELDNKFLMVGRCKSCIVMEKKTRFSHLIHP